MRAKKLRKLLKSVPGDAEFDLDTLDDHVLRTFVYEEDCNVVHLLDWKPKPPRPLCDHEWGVLLDDQRHILCTKCGESREPTIEELEREAGVY